MARKSINAQIAFVRTLLRSDHCEYRGSFQTASYASSEHAGRQDCFFPDGFGRQIREHREHEHNPGDCASDALNSGVSAPMASAQALPLASD